MLRRIASLSLILFASLLAIGNKVNKVALLGEDAIPQKINYQGYLTDNTGNPINGTRTMTFKIYDAASGGNELWSETKTVSVENGLFNVILGEVNPISPDIFTPGARRWLELVVEGNPLSPRTEITAVGFSYKTVDADKLEGNSLSDLDGRYVNENQGDAISNAMIQNNAVTTAKIADGNVTLGKINTTGSSAGQAIISTGSGSPPTWGNPTPASHTHSLSHTGDVTGSGDVPGSWALTIANGAVTTAKIQDGAVTNPKLAANAVTTDKIQDLTITGSDIANNTIGTEKLNFTPATRPLSPGVSTAEIADGAVTNPKLAANAVTSDKIQDLTITGSDIANSTIGPEKLNFTPGDITAVYAGTGLTGGGSSGDVTLSLSNTGVQPGSYTNANITVDAQGRITSASSGSGGVGGSGTANYVPRWTGSTTLGNSSIQDAGAGYMAVGGSPSSTARIYGYSGLTFGCVGFSSASNGAGVAGSATGSGPAAGVFGTSDNNTRFGVWGHNSNSSGTGVMGTGNNLGGTYLTGGSGGAFTGTVAGAFGTSASATGFGIYGINTNSSGTGIIGIGNNTTGSYLSGGSGGAFTGTSCGVYGATSSSGAGYYAVYGYQSASGNGTGYGYSYSRSGVNGYIYWGDNYAFGATGYTYGDYTRTGGVFGGSSSGNPPTAWGSLGYKNSGGTHYGGYGTTAWTSGSGDAGIGCGWYGNLMGGWLKGKHYGAHIAGNRYALYTKGNNFTTGYTAVLHETETKREATYMATSTTVDIYTSGIGEMRNGEAVIQFSPSFTNAISPDVPVVVTVTPMGPCENQIYLEMVNNTGFTVKESNNGKSSVRFSWIAIGRRAGYERNPEIPAELTRKDFDAKMDKVMFDENNTRESAQPVWFDGTTLRFEPIPEGPKPPKTEPSEIKKVETEIKKVEAKPVLPKE